MKIREENEDRKRERERETSWEYLRKKEDVGLIKSGRDGDEEREREGGRWIVTRKLCGCGKLRGMKGEEVGGDKEGEF
mgnify:CR=1 FL=1